jgi:hypothetical protein
LSVLWVAYATHSVTRTLRMSVLDNGMQSTLRMPCKVLGTLRTTTGLVRVFM